MSSKYIHYKRKSKGKDKMDSQFSLHVRDPWLKYIQIGIKTVEGRRGNSDKFKHWLGQKVYFYNDDRKIPVMIKEIHHYPDLYAYLDKEGYNKVLPGVDNYRAAVDIYHEFYSDDSIKEVGGMLGIVVELI